MFDFCGDEVTHRSIPTYHINLDLPPNQRYDDIIAKNPTFNATVWDFYTKYFANDKILTDVLRGITNKRGPENDEMQAEIEGLVAASKLPIDFVKGIQPLYELQTLMVPIVNFSLHIPGFENLEAGLKRLPWRGPGCTGIIARCDDGIVYHARNLDFQPLDIMNQLVYNGIFMKNGTELFRSQLIAGYTQVITGARMGKDGYIIERNTRYGGQGSNVAMIRNVLSGREMNGWTLRKILETTPDYDTAVEKIVISLLFVSTLLFRVCRGL